MRIIRDKFFITTKLTWHLSILFAVAGVLFSAAAIFYQYNYYSKPKKVDLSEVVIATEEDYPFHIDEIAEGKSNKYISISGWALHRGVMLNHFNTKLVLYKENLSDALLFPLAMQVRKDVTEQFDDGYDYDASGFRASIARSEIADYRYKVALLYRDEKDPAKVQLILTDSIFLPDEITAAEDQR